MHADNGGVDHLDSGIMGSGKRFYDAAPNTGPPPPDEAVVASGVWAKRRRQITRETPPHVSYDILCLSSSQEID